MKKSNIYLIGFFLASMLLMSISASAQEKYVMHLQGYNEQPYHFGFILGINQMLFTLKTVDKLSTIKWTGSQSPDISANSLSVRSVTARSAPGFSVGILGNLLISHYVDLRFIPTLSFGSRSLVYKIQAFGLNDQTSDSTVYTTKQLNSTYLVFPLLLKYRSWRRNNVGAYILGGVSYSIDLAAAKRTNQHLGKGVIKMKTNDVGLQVGAGFDFYTNYFKLSIEAKMIYGLNNLIIKENDIYSGSIDQLHSKIFMLSFTFE